MTNNERRDRTPAGNALAMGISLGMVAGAVLGLLVFDNLALGIGIGMCLGITVSTAMGAQATGQRGPAEDERDD
ncbi:hypothetical protein [Streptomyces sp. G45]|uniref:hypothetical protein n=1 Tax=Streptomyces sp. G45 TaxID=3406627 RepID=UPI003C1663BD